LESRVAIIISMTFDEPLSTDLSEPLPHPHGPLKPGPVGSYEEAIERQLLVLQVVYLIVHGKSNREIARELGIARTTLARMRPEIDDLNDFGPALARFR
jgi:DNA-binding NarL/FixJ family response regulator